ncbi:MAG: D-aminoacyl-tRNA deacylase [Chloroflexota bacterium]|jgi:D-tyrosyl-tRNA(Tyr) deacylase
MRVLLQRVTGAQVSVAGDVRGSIGHGLLALVGVGPNDTADIATSMAAKSVDLRIFRDDEGRTNRSLADVGGALLVVSQFTLYGDTRKGRRPSFVYAAEPALAVELVEVFAAAVEARGIEVGRGEFGAEMQVELVNDGPMTIWLDSAA